MLDQVSANLANHHRIGVAVSGGADSVFLLHALHHLDKAAAILHINHKLRGKESDEDETFVRHLAEKLNLPFHTATLPPTEGNTEQEARRQRYAFFQACVAQNICDHVATGHTLDDQSETVLFRFLRGSGTAGLSGIRPAIASEKIIRPLLNLRRADIRQYLTTQQIPWREDSSNVNEDFQRNRIRKTILPELTRLNPSLPEVLAGTATWAQAEEDYWTTELNRLEPLYLKTAPENVFIEIQPFAQLPLATQRRLLRHALERVRGHLRSIGFQHIEAVRALMSTREGSGRIQLPDLDIYRSFDLLRVAPQHFDARQERNFSVPMTIPGETAVPERLLTIAMELVTPSHVYNGDENALDQAKCPGPLHLRNWRPGDQFDGVKIKTLFQDYRIPLWERRRWPVIVMDDEAIVWTRRFGVTKKFAATPGSESILLVQERSERS